MSSSGGKCTAASAAGGAGSSTCAWVASLWPLVEGEVHGVLKELIKLHTAAAQPERAARAKALYRRVLTQREILGTGMLVLLNEGAL